MLTKQQWCGLTLLGCVIGMACAAIAASALWSILYRPFWFWLVLVAALVNVLLGFVVGWVYEFRAWWRTRREPRIEPTYICLQCGYYAYSRAAIEEHRCVVRRERKGEGEL